MFLIKPLTQLYDQYLSKLAHVALLPWKVTELSTFLWQIPHNKNFTHLRFISQVIILTFASILMFIGLLNLSIYFTSLYRLHLPTTLSIKSHTYLIVLTKQILEASIPCTFGSPLQVLFYNLKSLGYYLDLKRILSYLQNVVQN